MYITRIEFFALFLSILGGADLFVNRKCSVLKLKRFIPSGLASYVLRISESALVSVGRVDVSVGVGWHDLPAHPPSNFKMRVFY